jgi:malate synthase
MAAFIPSRRDAEVNTVAFAKVREDKTREAGDGFDGSWVAHPDLVPVAREIFDGVLGEAPNQLGKLRLDVAPDEVGLLAFGSDPVVTRAGLELNVDVGIRYLAAWLGGLGAVGIHNLMEDAATAEISRSQIWQWVRNGTVLSDTGEVVTAEVVRACIAAVEIDGEHADAAKGLFEQVALAGEFVDFLTLPAYDLID